MAQRRQQIARESPEPSWVGSFTIWTGPLNAALAFRAVARFRPVQYLAALVFVVSSVGMLLAASFVGLVAFMAMRSPRNGGFPLPLELMICVPAAAWLAVSPLVGILIALFSRRRTCSRPLAVVRFMGSPAREFLRAWDVICLLVDKKIGRFSAAPLVWLLTKRSRFITLAVILIVGFLLIAYGLLMPAKLVAWGNQFGSGLRAVGGGGFTFVIILMILAFLGILAFMLFVAYVWFRSALVAIPSLLMYVLAPAMDAELAPVKPFAEPVIDLVTFLPSGIAEAYSRPSETVTTEMLVQFLRIFIGSPGFPTTIGMILTGVLIGWLPHFLEQLDRPTPREIVARHGWSEANEQAEGERAHQVFVSALWGGGFAALFFVFSPTWYLVSPLEKTGWYTFLFVVIPVGTFTLVLRAIVKKVRKSGKITRPRPLDMSAEEAHVLGAPEDVSSIAKSYSPLARLLSEAQRRRSAPSDSSEWVPQHTASGKLGRTRKGWQ